jgi:hypothetical protein
MIERFLVLDHEPPPADAERIIFCDGAGGDCFREDRDLDLSHWRPNRTPLAYRADTSTEICFRFLDHPQKNHWTLAVNNHLDVDGMLSVYTLVHSDHARANRQAIVQAAEMGDFWAWGEPPAQRLFQGLTRLMNARRTEGLPIHEIYEEAFRRTRGLLDQNDPDSVTIDASLAPLRQGVELVAEGSISRVQYGGRLAHYVIPRSIVGDRLEQATYIPKFNELISSRAILWPQVRARCDGERMCLVSVDGADGWYHDLWYPGYLWADIAERWMLPGMNYRHGMESYDLAMPAFDRAIEELNAAEKGAGTWNSGSHACPLGATVQGQFPLAARTLDAHGLPTSSSLEPDAVAALLAPVFADS